MTTPEALRILEGLRDALLREGRIGDLRPLALAYAIGILKRESEP